MRKNTKAVAFTAAPAVAESEDTAIDLNVANVALDTLINEMVKATNTVYGANIRIAAKLNDLMPFDWFDIEYREVSENAKILAPHKTAVLDGFRRSKHTNESKAYADIRKYGRNLRAGYSANGKTMADGSPLPDGAADADNGANPAKRSPMLRNIEELTKLWKFNAGLDATPDKVAAAQSHIVAALAALGIDVRTIK